MSIAKSSVGWSTAARRTCGRIRGPRVAEALDLLRGYAGRVQGGQRHVGQEAKGRQVALARVGHVEQRVVDGAPGAARRLREAQARQEVGAIVEVADAGRALDEVAHALGHLHHRLVYVFVLEEHRGLQAQAAQLAERVDVGPGVGEVEQGPVLAAVVLDGHDLPGAGEVGRHGGAQPAIFLAPGGQVQHHSRLGVGHLGSFRRLEIEGHARPAPGGVWA